MEAFSVLLLLITECFYYRAYLIDLLFINHKTGMKTITCYLDSSHIKEKMAQKVLGQGLEGLESFSHLPTNYSFRKGYVPSKRIAMLHYKCFIG